MATPKVLLKRSSIIGRVPDSSDLQYGELAINFADGKLYYKDDSNNIKAFVDSARVQAIADAVETVAEAQLDSAEVSALIDSAYVQLRVPLSYIEGLIDSAYIQAKQDFAYGSLTGTPNILDSSGVTDLIDATYIQANQITYDTSDFVDSNYLIGLNVSTFTNNAGYVDDSYVGNLPISTFTNDANYLDSTTGRNILSGGVGVVYDNATGEIAIDSNSTVTINRIIVDSGDIKKLKFDTTTYTDIDVPNNLPTFAEGNLFYFQGPDALAYSNTDINVKIGQDEIVRVYNNSGSDIAKGKVVYVTGAANDFPTIALAKADTYNTIYSTIGLTSHAITNGSFGFVTVRGLYGGLNTAAFNAGDLVHVSFDSAGELVNTQPQYPNYPYEIGTVLVADSASGGNVGGCIQVNPRSEIFEGIRVQGNSRFDADLTVTGNLNILGTETITQVQNLQVSDNFIYIGAGDTVTTLFDGTGTNDGLIKDYYEGDSSKYYFVYIYDADSVNGGDLIRLHTGDSAGAFDNSTSTQINFDSAGGSETLDLSVDRTLLPLRNNIKITFETAGGHDSGDYWYGLAAPVNQDLGIVGNYNTPDAPYSHAGFFRDADDQKFKIFNKYDPEVSGNINTSDPSFELGTMVANTFEGDLTGDVTGTVSDISNHSTTGLSEGTNLYYTTARHDSDTLVQVDAAYVQARQTTYNTSDFTDSAFVTGLPVSTFTNDANYLDSTTVTGVIDATYIQANQTTYDFLDSAETIALIDSAHIAARQAIVDHVDVNFSSSSSTPDTTGALSNTLTGDGFGAIGTGTTQTYFSGTDASFFTLTGENSTTVGNTLTEILSGLSHRVDSDTFTFDQADSEAFYVKSDAGGYTYIYPTTTGGAYDDGKKLRLVNAGTYLTLRTTGVGGETSDRFARIQTGSWPPSFGVNFEAITEAGFLNINTLAITSTVTISNTPGTGNFLKYDGSNWVDQDLDSAIDSAYVQARQDFAYGSLTGTPTIPTLGTDFVDSGQVEAIVDSAYIELRRPAETIFSVAGDGSNYTFTGDGFSSAANNPTLYLTRGKTYKFGDISGSHPLEIRVSNGGAAYSDGVTNNGGSGTVLFTVDMDAPNNLVYQCTIHSGMVGDIVIVDNNSFLDSSSVTGVIDASYIQANQITYNTSNFTDSATVIRLITENAIDSGIALQLLLDSSEVVNLIDSAYVQARQSGGEITIQEEGTPLSTAATTLNFVGSAVTASGTGTTKTITISQAEGGTDSATVVTIINDTVDSAYVQARQTAGGGGGVDSAYVLDVASGGVTGLYQQTFYRFQADSGQTAFTGTDAYGQTLNYGAGAVDVFLNGILLLDSADYTQTSSSTLTLVEPADSADEIHIIWRRGSLVTPNVTTYEYTATGGQTTFTGTDANGETLAYAAGAIQVFVNGILLKASEDYTATDGTSVVLTTSASALDDIAIAAYAAPHAKATSFTFIADSGQAIFNGPDNQGNSLNYEPSNSLVFVNGIVLNDSDDFTATNGTSVTLTTAANLNDELKVVSFGSVTTTQSNNNWTETSTSIKISPNEKKFVDVSSNAVTLEIQDSGNNVSMGDELRIIDGYGNAASNNITLRSTKKIIGSDSDLIIDINRSGTNLVYYNESNGWVLIEN